MTIATNKVFWAVIAVLVILAALLLFRGGGPEAPLDVWKEPTVSYDPACVANTKGCKTIVRIQPGHRGESLPLAYNPNIDDAVAQWGDCLESVMACRREGAALDSCVAASSCPVECKAGYSARLSGGDSIKQKTTIFKEFFLEDGGPCVPVGE